MDRLFALLALATLIAFLAIIAGFVPDPDLIIVFGIVILLVIYDFWEALGPSRNRDRD